MQAYSPTDLERKSNENSVLGIGSGRSLNPNGESHPSEDACTCTHDPKDSQDLCRKQDMGSSNNQMPCRLEVLQTILLKRKLPCDDQPVCSVPFSYKYVQPYIQ